MFNPNPRIETVPIGPGQACYVVDDALAEPERWVQLAQRHRDRFQDSARNAFPGPELGFSPDLLAPLTDFFNAHLRGLLGGRRTVRSAARLSLVTRAPEALQPWQCFCHTDRMDTPPDQVVAASVLYLFRDPALGGTAFYAPRKPMDEIAGLIRASRELAPDAFAARTGIARGYMTGGNAWFDLATAVPARWNRAIFYSGMVHHSGQILAPRRLDPDPAKGRLTINAFYTCTRRTAA